MALAGAALGLAIGISACGDGDKGIGPRPNVLLISIDSTCDDLLGAYGRRPVHAPELSPSPNLDLLAAQGALFEDASSTTSWTLPAHISMLSGLPALVHAVDIDMQTPNGALPNLAEMLAAEGYRTAGFFSGPYLDPRFGFARGFDRYEACFGEPMTRATEQVRAARKRMDEVLAGSAAGDLAAAKQALETAEGLVEQLSHQDVSSSAVTENGLQELDRAAQDQRPFFLFLHYFDAHYDYTPPAPFDTRFDPDYTGDLDGRDFISRPEIATPIEGNPFNVERTVSQRDLEHVFALYEGELAWIDQEIGRVLDRLEALGMRDDTLVIVTADHGDEFFEHQGLGHRKTLYEEVLRVPLLVRYPGILDPGVRIAEPVSILSIVPTVLDALQLESELPLLASSLLPLAQGTETGARHGILGRLIYTQPAAQGFSLKDGTRDSVPVLQVYLTETYRKGAIKVIRRRQWVEFHAESGMPEPVRKKLEEDQRRGKASEDVRWIDIGLHPRESERFYSTNFKEPAARAVLQEFHDLYPRLLKLRQKAGETQANDGEQGMLDALGYGGGYAPDMATEAFEAPPPGAQILRE